MMTLQNWLGEFFTSKLVDFLRCRIEKLPDRQEAIVVNGEKAKAVWLVNLLLNPKKN